jgi:hypothetical protein
MNPQLYYAVMLITEPQKARRILLAEELENWFMDLFDDEFENILNGTFRDNQEVYIERIVDKYLEITNVEITNTDEYTKSVVDKAYKTATEIQETTYKNIVTLPISKGVDELMTEEQRNEFNTASLILGGIAIGSVILSNDNIKRWLGKERANLIALNEANWKWNNEEYYEAKGNKKTKTWHTALDERVRFDHMAVEGVTVGIDEHFIVGGYPMLYPLDGNAPIEQTANCRCSVSYQ